MVGEIKAEIAGGVGLGIYPPGELIAEELETRGWSQEDLARITGRPLGTINQIVKGKKAITTETSLDLAAAFGTSPDLWLGLENDYRLALAQPERGGVQRRSRLYSLVPVRELQRRHALSLTDDLDVLEKEVCALLRIASIEESPDLESMGIVAARRADGHTGSFTPAQVTWLFLARRDAEALKVPKFKESEFIEGVPNFPAFSVDEQGWRKVRDVLAAWGIRLVIVEPFNGTKIDGALFWLDERSPVVALSLRYDRVDHFWFTLMHELGHLFDTSSTVKKGHIDAELVGPEAQKTSDKPPEERKADRRASEWLIPQAAIKPYIESRTAYFSKAGIINLACLLKRPLGLSLAGCSTKGN